MAVVGIFEDIMLEVDRIHEDTQALPSADKTRDQSEKSDHSSFASVTIPGRNDAKQSST